MERVYIVTEYVFNRFELFHGITIEQFEGRTGAKVVKDPMLNIN